VRLYPADVRGEHMVIIPEPAHNTQPTGARTRRASDPAGLTDAQEAIGQGASVLIMDPLDSPSGARSRTTPHHTASRSPTRPSGR
jgi:hypothetical protein